MNQVYHRVEVENAKSTYESYDTLDFYIHSEGRALKRNSVRIEFQLGITKDVAGTPTRTTNADEIFLDHRIGGHSVFDSFTTEFQNQGIGENLLNYPKMVGMKNVAQKDEADYHSVKSLVELRCPSGNQVRSLMVGVLPTQSGAVAGDLKDIDISVKPDVCLNNMDADLSFKKTGWVKLSTNLSRVLQVLYGRDVNALNKYNIHNVKLRFTSIPDVNNNVNLSTTINLKSSINSAFSNTASKVPAVCNSVSCVFLPQSNENSARDNNNELATLPSIDELSFNFSDSTSKYVSYIISDKDEMRKRFIESLGDTGHNQLNANNNPKNFGIGLKFPPTDLSQQKFNIQIKSSQNNISTNPFIIQMFFHSILAL